MPDLSGDPLIILTAFDTYEDIDRALLAGACGYVLKNITHKQIESCLHHAMLGRKVLSPSIAAKVADRVQRVNISEREQKVLRTICEGLTNKKIANKLFVTVSVVKLHASSLFAKLGGKSRTEAFHFAIRNGLVRFHP